MTDSSSLPASNSSDSLVPQDACVRGAQRQLPLPGVPCERAFPAERSHTVWKMLGPAFGALALLLVATPAVLFLRASRMPNVPIPTFAESEPGAGRKLTAALVTGDAGEEVEYIAKVEIGQRILVRGPTLVKVPATFDGIPVKQLFNARSPAMQTAYILAYIYDGSERQEDGAATFKPANMWMSSRLMREQDAEGARHEVRLRGGGLLFLDVFDAPAGVPVYFLLPGSATGNPARAPATQILRPPETGCGDGLKTEAEECDDVNSFPGDGCSPTCTVEPGWECILDLGTAESTCRAVCGDGIIARGNVLGAETCDDGNALDGDGCSAACDPESSFTCEGEPSECTGR